MKKTAVFLLAIMIFSKQLYAQRTNVNEIKVFSVSAEAVVRVMPDIVVLHIGAETEGLSLNAVKQTNFNIIKSALEIIKKHEIEDKYIGTDNVELNTWYRTVGSGSTSYREQRFTVTQRLSITINDISKYDPVLTELVNIGINKIYRIEFQTTELKKHRYEARSLAIAAAKEKAEFLSREAGFSLEKIINLSESTSDYYGRPTDRSSGMSQNVMQITDYDGSVGESDTLALGMISIRTIITLYYSIAE